MVKHEATGAGSRRGPARLADVAALAGVSQATASKAMNGRRDVSAETRRRVMAAVTELGYRATAPRRGYPAIAVVADDLSTPYTLEVLRGAITAAMAEGVAVTALYTPETAPEGVPVPLHADWLAQLKAEHYLGLVTVTAPITQELMGSVREVGLPLVLIDPANRVPDGVASIGATNWNGGVDATRHLLELGHRRIAFIKGPDESVPSTERLQGYLSALAMAGVVGEGNLVAQGDFGKESAMSAATALLRLPRSRRPTAFFAANDVMALGVYEAVRAAGLAVPGDVSVVGFDDSMLAGVVTPTLTTVRQPLAEMGSAAVRTLLDLRRGLAHHGPLRLATRLVVRGSTGPA